MSRYSVFGSNEVIIGRPENQEIYTAEIKDGKISRIHGWDLVSDYYDQDYVSMCSSTHSITIGKKKFEVGMPAPKQSLKGIDKDDRKRLESACYSDGLSYCSRCGTAHDTDSYSRDRAWIITDCEVYCKDCVPADEALVEVETSEDLFKARDVQGIDLKGYIEVETLFCDSSGFGAPYERALTKKQATEQVEALIEKHGPLYAGLTGIGQFQVYVTLYKKQNLKTKKRA